MRKILKIFNFIILMLFMFGFTSQVWARPADGITGDAEFACYACGNSRHGNYVWGEVDTYKNNSGCAKTAKTKAECDSAQKYNEDARNDWKKNPDNPANKVEEYEDTTGPKIPNLNITDSTCEGLLGNEFRNFLTKAMNAIRTCGLALVLVFSTVDFAKALISQEQDLLKKASQQAIKRLGIAVALFFAPILLNIILGVLGNIGICI